jgi:hypothetical protein
VAVQESGEITPAHLAVNEAVAVLTMVEDGFTVTGGVPLFTVSVAGGHLSYSSHPPLV